MAEVQGVRDFGERPLLAREMQRSVSARKTGVGALILTFMLGVIFTIALGIAALSFFDIQTTISWPAGRIEVGQITAPHVQIVHGQK